MKTPPTTEVADGVLHAFASEEARHLLFKRALPKAVPWNRFFIFAVPDGYHRFYASNSGWIYQPSSVNE
jgi:hypothetical protein